MLHKSKNKKLYFFNNTAAISITLLSSLSCYFNHFSYCFVNKIYGSVAVGVKWHVLLNTATFNSTHDCI